jgi:GNAT superfamily N-acetyltransferase
MAPVDMKYEEIDMKPDFSIQKIVTDRDRRAFLRFPYQLYRDDPNWIPRLWPDQLAWLRRDHGFFEHAYADWYVLKEGKRVLGTIGIAIDEESNQHLNRQDAIFGFFECVEDLRVFEALIEVAIKWARDQGCTHLIGPRSFTPNDYPGFLLGRFDTPAALYEGHTPSYYAEFAEELGWEINTETLAYRAIRKAYGEKLEGLPAKLFRVAQRASRNRRVEVRPAELTHFEREFKIVLKIYNKALSRLREFVPMAEAQFREFAKSLQPVLHEDMILFAMVDGEEVGFSLALPNLAEAFHRSGGLRFPWNYLQLWWHAPRVRSASFKILAIDPDYWGLGLEALMFIKMIEAFEKRSYQWVDASLTGGDNPYTNKIATRFGLEEYKRYRLYRMGI